MKHAPKGAQFKFAKIDRLTNLQWHGLFTLLLQSTGHREMVQHEQSETGQDPISTKQMQLVGFWPKFSLDLNSTEESSCAKKQSFQKVIKAALIKIVTTCQDIFKTCCSKYSLKLLSLLDFLLLELRLLDKEYRKHQEQQVIPISSAITSNLQNNIIIQVTCIY